MADPANGFPRHTQIKVSPFDDVLAGFVLEICNEQANLPHPSIVSFEEVFYAYLTFELARSNFIGDQDP